MLDLVAVATQAEQTKLIVLHKFLGKVPKLEKGQSFPVAEVYCHVTAYVTTEDQRGEKVKFFGDFLAYTIPRGGAVVKSIRSRSIVFPWMMTREILGRISSTRSESDTGVVFDFAIRVLLSEGGSKLGYQYLSDPIVEFDVYSPLDRLLRGVLDRMEDGKPDLIG